MNSAEFLDRIHGPDHPIHFRAIGTAGVKMLHGPYLAVRHDLTMLNAGGSDIYFVVNKGGTRNDQICEFTAVWSDLDAGRTPDQRYKPIAEVSIFKASAMGTLLSMNSPPSIIVETRNGYHAYWLLEPGVTLAMFRNLIERITVMTGGDRAATRPSNLLRVPGFDWRKLGEHHEPFSVTVVHSTERRYSGELLLSSLGRPEGTNTNGVDARTNNDLCFSVIVHPFIQRQRAEDRTNKDRCTSGIVRPVEEHPKTLTQIRSAIKALDMTDLFQLPAGGIKCPFHDDTHPSAGIFRNETTNSWYFKCHATSCGFSGDAIDFLARKEHIGAGAALLRLGSV